MQIIGQKSNLEIINNWKKLPQFIILQGDKHTGKNHFSSGDVDAKAYHQRAG